MAKHFVSQPAFSADEIGANDMRVEGKAPGVHSAQKAHVKAAKNAIGEFVQDGLAADRAKKPWLEAQPTQELLEKVEQDKEAAKRVKNMQKKEHRRARKAREKLEEELVLREEEKAHASK